MIRAESGCWLAPLGIRGLTLPNQTQRVGPPKQEPKMTDQLLTPKEVADMLKVTTDTLESWRAKRLGPAFIKLGEGKRSPVRYRRSALDEYLKASEA